MTKYKLVCLGNGTALDLSTFNNNFLLTCDEGDESEEYLALDVGRTWPEAMAHSKFDWKKLTAAFITHLHADHIGGLEWLGFSKFFKQGGFQYNAGDRNNQFVPNHIRPKLIGAYEVIDELWNYSLRGGMESLQGSINELNTYFDSYKISPNGIFEWRSIVFSIVQTVHVVDQRRIKPSAGLLFDINDTRVFYSGDTQFCPHQLITFYNLADIIFHDCEMANYPQSVHAQYHELCTLPKEIRKKMHLMHHNSDVFEVPENFEEMGFAGFVKEGQVFEF